MSMTKSKVEDRLLIPHLRLINEDVVLLSLIIL